MVPQDFWFTEHTEPLQQPRYIQVCDWMANARAQPLQYQVGTQETMLILAKRPMFVFTYLRAELHSSPLQKKSHRLFQVQEPSSCSVGKWTLGSLQELVRGRCNSSDSECLDKEESGLCLWSGKSHFWREFHMYHNVRRWKWKCCLPRPTEIVI